jgi:hypothetical protein
MVIKSDDPPGSGSGPAGSSLALLLFYKFMTCAIVFFVLAGPGKGFSRYSMRSNHGTAQVPDTRLRVSPAHFHLLSVSVLFRSSLAEAEKRGNPLNRYEKPCFLMPVPALEQAFCRAIRDVVYTRQIS